MNKDVKISLNLGNVVLNLGKIIFNKENELPSLNIKFKGIGGNYSYYVDTFKVVDFNNILLKYNVLGENWKTYTLEVSREGVEVTRIEG